MQKFHQKEASFNKCDTISAKNLMRAANFRPHQCCVCVIFFACMCVGTFGSKTASDDPSSSVLCVMCAMHFPRGFPGGGKYAPPRLRTAFGTTPRFFFWGGGRFLLFLVDFAIFSDLLNQSRIKGLGFWYLWNT
jgi:hypothetical protein